VEQGEHRRKHRTDEDGWGLSQTDPMFLRNDPLFFTACRRAVGEAVEQSRDGFF